MIKQIFSGGEEKQRKKKKQREMLLESKWANVPDDVESENKNIKSYKSHYNKPPKSSRKGSPKKTIHNNSTTINVKKDNISYLNKSSESDTKQSSKLELLKQKIEEQKNILKAKHKEQQQKLLEDFLNDESSTLDWAASIDDEEKLLERINKL